MSQNHDDEGFGKAAEAAAFVAGGLTVGVGVAVTVGGMGLAVKGTAVAIGAAPVIATGVVVGLAAYGLKEVLT